MEKVKAHLVVEIMGRPPEHVKESVKLLIEKMGSEKGVGVIKSDLKEPEKVKDSKDLYMTFADIEAEFETLNHFLSIVMSYMPSHVEVFEPERFKFSSSDVNEMSNFIVAKLHRYDEIVKRVMAERDVLFRQMKHLREGGKLEDIYGSKEEGEKKVNKKKTKSSPKKKA